MHIELRVQAKLRGSLLRFVCLAFVLLSGCAARKIAPTGEAGIAATEGHGTDLAYRFRLVQEPALAVKVTLTFRGAVDGKTDLRVSRNWGGVETGGEDVLDLGVVDSKGRALEVEHPEANVWRVQHAPGESLRAEYRFGPNDYQDDNSPDVHRRSILNAGLLHFIGELGLVMPAHLDGEAPRRASFAWEGLEAAHWQVATSFGIGPQEVQVKARPSELREAVYMAGDYRLLKRDVHGHPVHVAIHGKWNFTDEAFADLTGGIVGLERSFFNDFDTPFYLITLVDVGKPSPGTTSFGGTGLTNSFDIAMLSSMQLEGDFARNRGVRGLLAHEMFHNWNGHIIQPQDPEELVYWFSEGFTDFYARRLLYRGGFLTREDYAGSVNKTLDDLFTSPVREAPNERIQADFWHDRDVKRLPYLRGEMVALMLDQALRQASGGKHDLDDFMRELVRDGRRGQRVSTPSLLERIRHEAGAPAADRLRLVVEKGRLPDIDVRLLQPCFDARVEEVRSFDLGFDFERTRQEHKICGLRPGSNAAQAGLKEGLQIAGWSVQHGDATKPVVLKVRDEGGERQITFLPAGPATPVVHFTPRPGASGKDCRCL